MNPREGLDMTPPGALQSYVTNQEWWVKAGVF